MNSNDILLIEDNPGDARLIKEALQAGGVAVSNIHHVVDGAQAMEFLQRDGEFNDAPEPGLVLLDLNLPKMDGRTVLTKMKTDPVLQEIPVIILTTSFAGVDVEYCYKNGANAFMTKAANFDDLMESLNIFRKFWLSIVQLPHGRLIH